MALPRFCDDCESLLSDIDPGSRIASCPKCSKPHTINPDDRTVLIVINNNNNQRLLSEQERNRLHDLPTTSRIAKKCTACGYEVASVVHDTSYNFSIQCLKCGESF